jgi:hypothetical protein
VGFVTILLPSLVLGIVLTFVVWTVLRVAPKRFRPTGEAPVGTMVSGIVLVFAFILGLTVSQESSTLAEARAATAAEANSIGELYWDAHALSEPEHSRLQGLLRLYAKQVIKDFPLLGQHLPSPQVYADLRAIREDILGFQPSAPIEKAVYGDMLTQVSKLFSARRTRVDAATNGGVPPILIQGLIVLAALILLFIPYAGSLNGPRNLIFYGAFAAFLIATILFIKDLNNPFAGTVAVQPTSFDILFRETFTHVS